MHDDQPEGRLAWMTRDRDRLQAERDALAAEVESLRADLDRLIEPKLVALELEPGGALRMDLEPGIGAKVLAASFADLIGAAKNWRSIEVGPMPTPDQGVLIVTVRRKDGQTPEETVAELRAKVASDRETIHSLRERLNAAHLEAQARAMAARAYPESPEKGAIRSSTAP